MLVVTSTYPHIVLENKPNKFCIKLIQNNYKISYEDIYLIYSIIANNRIILPINQHQVLADEFFYVDLENKNDILSHTQSFYVIININSKRIKLSRIEGTSIAHVNPLYLRTTKIQNLLL